MRQQFHNKQYTHTQVKNNILKVWDATNDADRYDWYGGANTFAHDLTRLSCEMGRFTTVNKVCGVIAALSPMVKWERNLELAHRLVTGTSVKDMPCIKSNARKANEILCSDGSEKDILRILNGQKISAFFLNIVYPTKAIHLTMDRHAISIAVGKKIQGKNLIMTSGQYEFFSDCYRWTAAKLGISPLLLQSATWILWRREGRNTELPYTLQF